MNNQSKIQPIETFLDKQVGRKGTKKRKAFELGFKAWLLGETIKSRRQQMSYSQQRLAEETGVSRTSISEIENGSLDVKYSDVLKLLQALNLRLPVS